MTKLIVLLVLIGIVILLMWRDAREKAWIQRKHEEFREYSRKEDIRVNQIIKKVEVSDNWEKTLEEERKKCDKADDLVGSIKLHEYYMRRFSSEIAR